MNPQTVRNLPWAAVFGPAWPLWATLGASLAALSLFFGIVAAAGNGISPVLIEALAFLMAVTLILIAWTGVSRQGMLKRRWRARIAPSLAVARLDGACALGLTFAWLASFCVAAPWVLAQHSDMALAFAYVSALSALLAVTVVLAAAWQGRLSGATLALPLLVLISATAAGGVSGAWLAWKGATSELHAGVMLVALPLVLAVLNTETPPYRGVPAATLARAWQRWRDSWRQRHLPVPGLGQSQTLWAFITLSALPPLVFAERWDAIGLLTSAAGQAWLLVVACPLLHSPDLHWRMQLAPGRYARHRVGWRMVLSSLQHHLLVAALLFGAVGLFLFLVSSTIWRDFACAAASLAPTLLAKWALAVMACVWLRGMRAPFAIGVALGLSICVAAVLVGWAATLTLGALPRGLPSILTTALAAALLYRPIRTAWATRDLAEFMPCRSAPN